MGDTLTIEVLNNVMRSFPPAPRVIQVIEVLPTPIYGPVRRHRRRRIQKKWLKRYGQKIVGYDCHFGDQVYVHEKTGAAFCHPDVAARLRYEMRTLEREAGER